jgi:hypothetical protein
MLGERLLSRRTTMSHFAEIECEYKAESKDELIEALEKEFGKGHVEFHEKGSDLYGFGGDNRSNISEKSADYAPPCEIVVRRKHVGSAANDVGFKFQPDGSIKGYVSDYDRRNTFNKPRRDAVAVDYQLRVGEKLLKAKGATKIERVKLDNGSVRLIGKFDAVSAKASKIEVKGF